MKKTKFSFLILNVLAFLILFAGFYFISVEKDFYVGVALIALSIVAIIVGYVFLKKEYTHKTIKKDPSSFEDDQVVLKTVDIGQDNDFSKDDNHKEEETNDTIPSDENKEFNNIKTNQTDQEIEKSPNIDEKVHDFTELMSFKVIVNDDFNDNILKIIEQMIENDMFLDSLEYNYSIDEIKKHNLVKENLYKYQFHPVPVVSLSRDHRNKKIINVFLGLYEDDAVQIGYVPQTHIDAVHDNYQDIKNIKADLLGGVYRVYDPKFKNIREYRDPFIVNLRLYK